jgi:hypothetical protein
MSRDSQSTTALTPPPGTTVARELVHKLDPEQVLPLSWRQSVPNAHRLAARWPGHHPFYASEHGLGDPLLLVELIRQSSILLAHSGYAVPLGDHLLWEDFGFTSDLDGLRQASDAGRPGPGPIVIDAIGFNAARRRDHSIGGLGLSFNLMRDGDTFAVGWTRFSVLSGRVYQRVRGERAALHLPAAGGAEPEAAAPGGVLLGPPLPAELVGRPCADDVLLSPGTGDGGWRLRVDPRHPILFDHPVDHVPGTVLIDAARQAVRALGGHVVPVAMECAFTRYVEFDAPCRVQAELLETRPGGCPRYRVSFLQDEGAPACVVTATAAPLRGRENPGTDLDGDADAEAAAALFACVG